MSIQGPAGAAAPLPAASAEPFAAAALSAGPVPAGAIEASPHMLRSASRTSSELTYSTPGMDRRFASTRSTFHPGRLSPTGRAAPVQLCHRPSTLTYVPEDS